MEGPSPVATCCRDTTGNNRCFLPFTTTQRPYIHLGYPPASSIGTVGSLEGVIIIIISLRVALLSGTNQREPPIRTRATRNKLPRQPSWPTVPLAPPRIATPPDCPGRTMSGQLDFPRDKTACWFRPIGCGAMPSKVADDRPRPASSGSGQPHARKGGAHVVAAMVRCCRVRSPPGLGEGGTGQVEAGCDARTRSRDS